MLPRHKKQGPQRWLRSPLFCIVLLVVAVLLGKSIYGLYLKVETSAEAKREAGQELAAVMARKDSIEKEINRLKTSEGMEEEIRRKFNVAKEGEQVILVVGNETPPPEPPQKTFFQGIKEKLKNMLY